MTYLGMLGTILGIDLCFSAYSCSQLFPLEYEHMFLDEAPNIMRVIAGNRGIAGGGDLLPNGSSAIGLERIIIVQRVDLVRIS